MRCGVSRQQTLLNRLLDAEPVGFTGGMTLRKAQGRLAAQRVLADREQFVLDADGQKEWERINSRPARSLAGLARLLQRPSPFVTPAPDQPEA